MRKKGYEPLATDSFGGIGFRKSLKKKDEEDSCQLEVWPGEIWFDTGKKMRDGVTPRTVMAKNEEQYSEYLKKGYRPIKKTRAEPDE